MGYKIFCIPIACVGIHSADRRNLALCGVSARRIANNPNPEVVKRDFELPPRPTRVDYVLVEYNEKSHRPPTKKDSIVDTISAMEFCFLYEKSVFAHHGKTEVADFVRLRVQSFKE